MKEIAWSDFVKVELRVGTIVEAVEFTEALQPAYKIWVDLGDLGVKKSSAQLTALYTSDQLPGQQVICVCNLPPKQVGPFQSEVLILGLVPVDAGVVLVGPDRHVPNGTSLA